MSAEELEGALATLVQLGRRGHRPSHHLARQILLSLAERLGDNAPLEGQIWLERARAATALVGPAWSEAVEVELSLACGEFAQCLDPRFLGLQNYDLEYTRAARARLDGRILAARALGIELPTQDAEILQLADRVLASFLATRGR